MSLEANSLPPFPPSSSPMIYQDEPPRRSPPLLEIGALAWLRQNLFKSWIDSIASIIALIFVVAAITSTINWAALEANWYVILYNLRLFLVARYPVSEEWRLWVSLFLFAATGGIAWAAWARASRGIMIAAVIVLALLFILPNVIVNTVPLPPAYYVAGNTPVVSGSSTQPPLNALAFTAQAGETITVRVAAGYESSDEALSDLFGFGDDASNLLRAAASNRLTTDARIAELNTILAGDMITSGQRTRFERELNRLQSAPPVTETYALNQTPVLVSVLDATTLEPIASAEVSLTGEPLSVTIPANGWYILSKTTPEGVEGVTLLEVFGIYPLFERNLIRGAVTDESGETVSEAARVEQYVRMSDGFTLEARRPQIDGENVPYNVIINNRYRGSNALSDYLRLYIAPLMQQINIPALLIVIAVAAGYIIARLLDRVKPHPIRVRGTSQRTAIWMIIASPIIAIVLTYGIGGPIPVTNTSLWGGLLLTLFLTITGITLSFPLGVALALGRRSSLPVVSTFSIIYIEVVRGVPLITVLFISQLLIPLVDPRLAGFPNVFRATVAVIFFSAAYLAENVRGGLQAIPKGQIEAARAIGLPAWKITMRITLPQALRAVIPALVGQFISLFKDTTLVAIVGLTDLLGIAENVYAQTEYIGLRREGLLFIVLIYFVFSYSMAALSRRIEKSGAGVMRRTKL